MTRDVTLTFEDGSTHVYNNAPDTVTPDEIITKASSDFPGRKLTGVDGGRASAETRESRIASIPGGAQLSPGVSNASSLIDKIKAGGETALSLATGLTGGAAGFIGGTLGGLAGSITSGKIGTPEGARMLAETAAEQGGRLTYTPRTELGRRWTGNVGEVLAPLAAIPPLEATNAARLGSAAIPQVRQAIEPIASAIANSPEADLARAAGTRALAAVTPAVKPEVARLARRAQDLNIDLRPDMLTDNRFMKMMGEAFEKVPLSGSRADQRQIAFNRAVGAEIGADRNAQRMTSDVFDNAITQSGERIGAIADRTPVPLDTNFGTTLDQTFLQTRRYGTDEVARIVGNYIADLREAASVDGVIPGEQFRKINSQIGRQRRGTQNGDLKMSLSDLEDDLHDALVRNIRNPVDLPDLLAARREYAIAKAIEPLVAKATTGDLSPAGLMGAVTATKDKKSMMARGNMGDLGDLARIGQLFLKEPRSSGTAERAVTFGALGGASYMEPHTAAGVYGAANLYNRAGPSATRAILANQTPPEAMSALDRLRQYLQ